MMFLVLETTTATEILRDIGNMRRSKKGFPSCGTTTDDLYDQSLAKHLKKLPNIEVKKSIELEN